VIGGEFGVTTRVTKMVGAGRNAQQITEFQYDSALTRDLLKVLQQMAQERGEWIEKSHAEVNAKAEVSLEVRDYREELLVEIETIAERLKGRPIEGIPWVEGEARQLPAAVLGALPAQRRGERRGHAA
jgi:hypothetical protein